MGATARAQFGTLLFLSEGILHLEGTNCELSKMRRGN